MISILLYHESENCANSLQKTTFSGRFFSLHTFTNRIHRCTVNDRFFNYYSITRCAFTTFVFDYIYINVLFIFTYIFRKILFPQNHHLETLHLGPPLEQLLILVQLGILLKKTFHRLQNSKR